jgi:hypothetical protein
MVLVPAQINSTGQQAFSLTSKVASMSLIKPMGESRNGSREHHQELLLLVEHLIIFHNLLMYSLTNKEIFMFQNKEIQL